MFDLLMILVADLKNNNKEVAGLGWSEHAESKEVARSLFREQNRHEVLAFLTRFILQQR